MTDTSSEPIVENMNNSDYVTGRELDACLELVRKDVQNSMITAESQIAKELAEMKGQNFWLIIGTGVTSTVAILGIMIAVMSFAGDRFDGGLSASGLTVRSEKNAEQLERILKILEADAAKK